MVSKQKKDTRRIVYRTRYVQAPRQNQTGRVVNGVVTLGALAIGASLIGNMVRRE